MKARKLYVVHQPARKHIPGKRLSLLASVLTIGASIGIGVTFNPENSWAGSCAGVYSSKAGAGSTSILGYFNYIANSYVDVVTYPGGNNINALATQPSTGNLFFVNRATGKVVTYNVNTGALTTLSGTVPTNPTIIGATFLPSGKLYIYYTNATLVEVNPATGSQTGSTITISGIPGNAGTTNGDIAIGSNGTLYALGDTSATTSQLYSITITGATTATATAVNGSNNISGVNAANGLAIDPATGKFYISASTGTYELNLTTKVATQLTATAGVNDLSACASSTPDLPTITKAFSPTSVSGTPATSALTLTLGNTNTVPLYSLQTLTDTLPSGLTVSSPNGLGGTCTAIAGNSVTATAGSNTISLNSGFNIPAGGCTVTVNVTTNSAGTYVNNIPVGGLKTFAGDNATAASSTLTVTIPPVTVSGTVFSDADADVTINGSDAGTNAGSGSLTIYAVDGTGKVMDKATVGAAGTYSLTNVTANTSVTLRLSNDSSVAVGATAPTTATIPSAPITWYFTGENKNGTVDGTIATLGNIALTTTTANVTNQNFGIRQPYTIAQDAAPNTCNPDYRTALNTGITAAGGQVTAGNYDLNWTAEWIAGPASGTGTPYATPRPVGPMPAVVVGNLASGAWVNAPSNANWISYPFRLSPNGDGNHKDSDLDGRNGEDGSGVAIVGTSDDVRLKFTALLTLPSNATTTSISLPIGAAMDNQFISIKVNGVENLSPIPTSNPQANGYAALQMVNITNGWQTGVNTIEVTLDSGPPLAGFLLAVQATTTQVCATPVTVSGTVFDDADGSKLQNGAEVGSNGGGLNAVLVDSTNKVVATTAVAANGTYSFSNVPSNATYTVRITTATATVGSAPPAVALPSGWVSTGENLNGTADGTVDGILSVPVTTTNVTTANLGIERQPTAVGGTASSQANPGGTTTVAVASTLFTGSTDPDGTVASYKITAFPSNTTSITINGTNYTSGSFPGAGVTITTAQLAGMTVDPIDGAVTVGIPFQALDNAGQLSSNTATVSLPFSAALTLTVSGTVFSDADADVTINGSDGGTNAGSSSLTIYAVDIAGKVIDKVAVAANGTYTLSSVPQASSVTLRLSNDSSVVVGSTAPTTSTIPSGWYFTGENKNGTVDGTIATLGNIALTTTTTNVTNQNFGIRQPYTIAPDTAPTTCNPDYRTALNTGITAAGGQVPTGSYDLNWTAEWIAGPASGPGTPYAPPRPVGVMPAVVTGNLAPGAWINEPANARWISYPFRLSVNGNGVHDDADLDGIRGEGNGATIGTSDDVRLKFTSQVTLPSNANTVSISLPVGVAIDNQFVSIKVNGVENLVPTPAANPVAVDYGTTKTVNITNGWQAGVNTIEVVADSGPDRVGFFLGVQAATTQVCSNPNVLLVKRITAINGDRTKNPNDNTALNAFVDDTTSTRQADDNSPNWPTNYLLGAINAGKVNPSDEIEYTIYFLNAGSINANTVRICDRLSANQDFKLNSYGASKDLQLQLGTSTVLDLTSANDAADRAQLISAGGAVPANCYLKAVNDNGTLMLDITGTTGVPALTTMPGSTGKGTPNNSYGFFRFVTKVKP